VTDLFDESRVAAATIHIGGRPHVSDMTMFQRLDWLGHAVVCDSWTERLPLMHFQTDISGGTYSAKVALMSQELARIVAGDGD
jgi:hypothetical protein